MKQVVFSFLLIMMSPLLSWSQIEAGFILSPNDITIKASDYIFETQGAIKSDSASTVKPIKERLQGSRLITNPRYGIYVESIVGQIGTSDQKSYPFRLTQAKFSPPHEGVFAVTQFDVHNRRVFSRTNCNQGVKWGIWNQGSEFSCTTVTRPLCTELKALQLQLKADDFEQAAKKITECKDTLLYLTSVSEKYNGILTSDDYKKLAKEDLEALKSVRDTNAKDNRLVVPTGVATPTKTSIFRASDIKTLSDGESIKALASSLEHLNKASQGCNALEQGDIVITQTITPRQKPATLLPPEDVRK